MAKINIEIGVLNVAMHNHDKGELSYENLFNALNNDEIEAQLDETHAACIGELNTNKKHGKQRYFLGQIYKYAKINPERDCLNTKTKKVATPEEKQALIAPKHLRPHFVKIPFVFIPEGHRLYVQTKHKNDSFGITRAKRVLELLVHQTEIFDKFGDVEVTIQPDSAEVEKLINRKDIDKLTLDIVRPNPDDIKSLEASLFEKMKRRNLKKQKVEYISTRSEQLVLDEEMKNEVKVAASNGKVVAEGVDFNNEKWKTSTEETNLIIKTSYVADRTVENKAEDPAEKHLIETAFDNHSEIIK
ncbi:DUF4747 family protein [Rodentibacter caecimuris]|uniref:DUF4747 family protein n=1 Tax=Rodentibacter caecimuris TaxID=1796644 RepID=UPI000986452C|nr:hypothetical protein BKG97_07615 [Rodentibacter heylii]